MVALERNLDIACINAGVGVGELFVEIGLDAELRSWPVMTTCMQSR